MSEKLLLEATTTAQWQALLQQAEEKCLCQLDEELESYLIFTLIRFTQDPELASKPLALDFLRSHHLYGNARENHLRDVGDQCLLVSGLFPQQVQKRMVSPRYYVDLGRSAYHHLSELLIRSFADLYQHLATSFVLLMDVLQNLRQQAELQPLQALDQWQHTGSQHAYRIITRDKPKVTLLPQHPVKH